MTPLRPGAKVGRYEVVEPIRLESVGALYRVHDAASGARFGLTPLPGVEGDIDGLYIESNKRSAHSLGFGIRTLQRSSISASSRGRLT